MVYVKQTVAQGQTITSDWGNDIQTQYDEAVLYTDAKIDEVQAQLSRNTFDNYMLWTELKYNGYIGGIDASNTKALFFEPFVDTDDIAATGLTYEAMSVNTTQRYAAPTKYSVRKIPTAHSQSSAGAAANDAELSTYRSALIDNSTTGGYELYSTDAIDKYFSSQIDLGSAKNILSLDIYADCSKMDNFCDLILSTIQYSLDGTTWTNAPNPSATLKVSTDTSYGGWKQHNLTSDGSYINARYLRFNMNLHVIDTYNRYNRIREIQVGTNEYRQSELKSAAKSLSFTCTEIKAYISLKNDMGASFTPQISFDGGTTFVNPTLVTSRQDSRDAQYTEYEYTVTGSGTNIVFRVVFNPSTDLAGYGELKRYGVHLM